ncbi:Ubiquitin carboxyl-terminal hydrolase [Arachis hypogaea]|nr:Ubiquitin carboxyl-terminal hydrolase [Arachis hypogaea]
MEKEQQEVKVLTTSKFAWTINNFFSSTRFFYSETFFVGPYSWQIAILPSVTDIILRGLLVDRLYAVDIVGWRSLNFKLSLVDQFQGKSTIINESENINIHRLKKGKFTWTINNFYSPQLWCKDFYSDTFFVGPYSWQIAMLRRFPYFHLEVLLVNRLYTVDIVGWRSLNFKLSLVDQLHGKSTIIKGMKSTALFLDFMGFCKMEKDYVQLLENSYSKYPSLIESYIKRNRSQRFNELSFTTLGKLLHFLKTKKVKDMMRYDARKELQDLWEEAEIRFDDLSWLEPHVKSALTYFENASKVEKLKAIVVDLEEKAKTLKAEIIAIDADLETTKEELAKAEEGFVARGLDDQLGYGIT